MQTSDDVARRCRDLRRALGSTIKELSTRSGVSTRMIVRLEDEDALRVVCEASQVSSRQQSALLRVVAQVARAFGEDPVEWMRAVFPGAPSAQLDRVDTAAALRQQDAGRRCLGNSAPEGIRGHLRGLRDARARERVESRVITGARVPYRPFADERSCFLKRFASCVIGSVDPSLEVEWATNSSDFLSPLLRPSLASGAGDLSRIDFAIGFLHSISREYDLWHYCHVPGIRVRLAFISNCPDLSWCDVVTGRSQQRGLLGAIPNSVADDFLRGVCRFSSGLLSTGKEWGLQDIGRRQDLSDLGEAVSGFFESNEPRIFVCDQATADTLRGHRIMDENLVDLARSRESLAPAYPLGIAVPIADEVFRGRVSRAIDEELLGAHASVTADIYAEYIQRALAMLLDKASDNDYQVPSYLQIHDTGRLPSGFLSAVELALDARLGRAERTWLERTGSSRWIEALVPT